MNELPDPLDELLRPPPGQAPEDLRRRLRDQSSRLIRRSRIARRLVAAGAMAACLLIATLTAWFVWPRPEPTPPMPPFAGNQPPKLLEVTPPERDDSITPVVLEWQAFDSKTNRAASYFLAGNKYLEASQDMESALRCYVQALDACSPKELEITPDDNWLVATLKTARLQEKDHE